MEKSDKLWFMLFVLLTKEYLRLRIKLMSFRDFDFINYSQRYKHQSLCSHTNEPAPICLDSMIEETIQILFSLVTLGKRKVKRHYEPLSNGLWV